MNSNHTEKNKELHEALKHAILHVPNKLNVVDMEISFDEVGFSYKARVGKGFMDDKAEECVGEIHCGYSLLFGRKDRVSSSFVVTHDEEFIKREYEKIDLVGISGEAHDELEKLEQDLKELIKVDIEKTIEKELLK